MGYPHHIFLIARLFPKQSHSAHDNRPFYRCIGAYYLHWPYAILAKTARFLSLLKNEYNAEIVKDEIRRAQFQYGRQKGAPEMPKLPCPYTMLLLASAVDNCVTSVAEKSTVDGLFSASTLSPNIGPWDEAPDDGITVIDVTDPADPAVCMLRRTRYTSAYDYEVVLLSPGEFVEYGDDDSDFKGSAILDGVRLITRKILSEVWPFAFKLQKGEEDEAEAFHFSLGQKVPHLSDLIVSPAIEIASQSGDTSQLENIVWMPGKAESFKQVLRTQKPFLDGALGLLIKILQHEAEAKSFVQLDLSGLHLSTGQVATIVSNTDILNSRPLAVNLSGNSILSSATVSAVLSAFPNLLRLTMLDTGLEDDKLFELFSNSPTLFHGLSDLVHPALLLAPYQQLHNYVHPHTFTLATRCDTVTSVSVPFFNVEKLLNSLVQTMHLIHIQHSETTWVPLLSMSTGVRVMRDEEVQYPLVDQPWDQRTVSCFPQMRIDRSLQGEGWLFVVDYDYKKFKTLTTNVYGFVKVNKEALARVKEHSQKMDGETAQGQELSTIPNPVDLWQIHDVRGFVSELEKEGRNLPENIEQLVTKFEEAIVKASERKVDDYCSSYSQTRTWSLVTYQDLLKFNESRLSFIWRKDPRTDFRVRSRWYNVSIFG